MIEFLKSPWDKEFDLLVREACSELIISSPYISYEPCKRIIDINLGLKRDNSISILLLTDLSRDTLLSGATNASALSFLIDYFQKIEIRFLPSIHAKIYVANDKLAIITSANMTNGGLIRNYEYGVKLVNSNLVKQIKKDILDYAALGTIIDKSKVKFLSQVTSELNELRIKSEKIVKSQLRSEFNNRLRIFDDEIIRLRVAGRPPHAIFADAILYFLNQRPMSTAELHPLIQRVHPDLCDDSIDRIIDGRHFGKKWKHAVRTAQQHLKKKGMIEFKDSFWRLKAEMSKNE